MAGDADGVGAAGANPRASDGLKALVETNLDRGEVVAAAAQGEGGLRDLRIAGREQFQDLTGRQGDLRLEAGEFGRNGDRMECFARGGEEVVRGQAGAGTMRRPLVLEKAGVGVDVAVLRWVGGARGRRAVLGIRAVVVLRPEAVEHEGGMCGALGGGGVRVAELGRPGQIQKIKIEGGAGAGLLGSRLGGRFGWRSRSRAGVAASQQEEDETEGTLLHAGRIADGFFRSAIHVLDPREHLNIFWLFCSQ